jgi:hypothetical protein
VAHAVVAIDEPIQETVGGCPHWNLEDREPATGAQHAPHLSQHCLPVVYVMQSGDADQSVDISIFDWELGQRCEVPLDTLILPCPGEYVRRIDRDQTEIKIGRKMIGQVAAAGRHIANHSAASQANMFKCGQEFSAPSTGNKLHRPMISLTAAIEDRLVRFEHARLLQAASANLRLHYTEHGCALKFKFSYAKSAAMGSALLAADLPHQNFQFQRLGAGVDLHEQRQ